MKVADGIVVNSEGKITQVFFSIQGLQFEFEAYVISLASCDMILRASWLQTLGIIQWDFQKLTMSFSLNNQNIALKG